MSADLVEARIGKTEALDLQRRGTLRDFLTAAGIDPRTMTCVEDGLDLVYSSLPRRAEGTTNGHDSGGKPGGSAVTEDNREAFSK